MKINTDKEINNIETLLNSMQNDEKTLRWFAFLLEHESIREKLKDNAGFPEDLHKYRNVNSSLNIINTVLAGLLISIIFFKIYISLFPLFFMILLAQYQLKKKGIYLAKIFSIFLQNEFTGNEIKNKTLYQICEILSTRYNVFSLVDTIFVYDNLAFKLFILFVFLFNTLMTQISILHCIIAIIASFKLFKIIQDMPFAYRNLYNPKYRDKKQADKNIPDGGCCKKEEIAG